MDVLIFGGQSNLQGQTESLPPGKTVAGAFEYRHREGILVPLAHPVGEDFGDLLLGVCINSGNDGSNAIAVIVSGTVDYFVRRMNARAAELGCTDAVSAEIGVF